MVELILSLGNSEANLLETAIVLFGLSNALQWCFFIVLIILLIVKYIKKENAPISKKKHSRNTNWKGR